MNDTAPYIKQLQLKIWLSKPPMERLRQMMEDNAALFEFWQKTQKPGETPTPKLSQKKK